MLSLFVPKRQPVETGLFLHTGEKGYIFVSNKRGEFSLFDRFSATTEGVYRSHYVMLEDSSDYAIVIGVVTENRVSGFEAMNLHDFSYVGSTIDDILALSGARENESVWQILRHSELLVLSNERHTGQAHQVIAQQRKRKNCEY